jgi:Arc/MetJ-type ribon-helix-helix transcriptional regulator
MIYNIIGGFMNRTLVGLQGPQELILEKVVNLGIFKTKSEAIRSAVNQLGKDHKLFKDAQALEDELVLRKMIQVDNEVKQGKRKILSEKEVKKQYNFK